MKPKIHTSIKFYVNSIQVAECSNIVTSVGIASISGGGFPSNISVGTGSQAEAISVTALSKPKHNISGTWYQQEKNKIDVKNNTITNTGTLRVSFAAEKENTIYTEVGITNKDGKTYTYALLRDSLGEVSSVTVLEGERLEIEYTVSFSYAYKHVGENSIMYLLGIPRIQDIPNNMTGGHYIGAYTGSNDPLELGTTPTGNNQIKAAVFRKIADKIITEVPAFIARPNLPVNGLYVYPDYVSDEYRRYTYCIAFNSPQVLLPDNTYKCTATLPFFLQEDQQ